uniref:Uncharacterized protein n=1 Tax=Anguilla anguilla TaxID=7936 RepID=A0A0E9VZJ6_ANGAN
MDRITMKDKERLHNIGHQMVTSGANLALPTLAFGPPVPV